MSTIRNYCFDNNTSILKEKKNGDDFFALTVSRRSVQGSMRATLSGTSRTFVEPEVRLARGNFELLTRFDEVRLTYEGLPKFLGVIIYKIEFISRNSER